MLQGASTRAQNLLETQDVGLGRRGRTPYIGATERWVPSSGSNTIIKIARQDRRDSTRWHRANPFRYKCAILQICQGAMNQKKEEMSGYFLSCRLSITNSQLNLVSLHVHRYTAKTW